MRFTMVLTFILLSPGFANALYGGRPLPSPLDQNTPVVSISQKLYDEKAVTCSAVIVGPRKLLLAAHCTETFGWQMKVRIVDPKTGGWFSNVVERIDRHPNYPMGFRSRPTIGESGTDIAVVTLKLPLDFPHQVVAIPSAADLQKLKFPSAGFLIANGQNESDLPSTNLALPITVARYSSTTRVSLFPLLATKATAGGGPCFKDSGGGVFAVNQGRLTFIAIQSTKELETGCGDPSDFGYVVPLSANLSWLQPAISQ